MWLVALGIGCGTPVPEDPSPPARTTSDGRAAYLAGRDAWLARLSAPDAPELACVSDTDCATATLECCRAAVPLRAEHAAEVNALGQTDDRCHEKRCAEPPDVHVACVLGRCTGLRIPTAFRGERGMAEIRARLAKPDAPERVCRTTDDCGLAHLGCCGAGTPVNRAWAELLGVRNLDPSQCASVHCGDHVEVTPVCIEGSCGVDGP